MEINSYSHTLFIVFLILKLTEVIDWSWWFITMPLWLPILFILLIFFLLLFLIIVAFIYNQF